MNYAIGFICGVAVFIFAAWLASLSLGGYTKDCEQLGKTRLAGVAVECRVIKP